MARALSLTAQGLRFTDGHSMASVCMPSRYSFLTGENSEAKTLSPRHDDDQVPVGALECRIEFDRPIKKGTGTISLHRLSDRQKLASVLVESDAVECLDDKTVSVDFPVGVEPKTTYSVTVEKGAFHDVENMKFLGMPVLGEWKFATK